MAGGQHLESRRSNGVAMLIIDEVEREAVALIDPVVDCAAALFYEARYPLYPGWIHTGVGQDFLLFPLFLCLGRKCGIGAAQ